MRKIIPEVNTSIRKKNIKKMADREAESRSLHFKVSRFIQESGIKLGMKSIPLATAAKLYHSFFAKAKSVTDLDPYVIGTSCLYLAGKIEEEHLKLRDVVNVCYRTLHKDKPPLDIGTTFWNLRETVVQTELFILRMLKFQIQYEHPHKFLLHFINSMLNWLEPNVAREVPIARTAWALLRDSYHGDICLKYKDDHIAIACLYLSLQCYGIEVPHSQQADKKWWEALSDDITIQTIRNIITDLIYIYELESIVPVRTEKTGIPL